MISVRANNSQSKLELFKLSLLSLWGVSKPHCAVIQIDIYFLLFDSRSKLEFWPVIVDTYKSKF